LEINSIGFSAGMSGSDTETVKTNASDKSFEESLKRAVETNDADRLKGVCRQFESIMLDMMYKQMKATVIKSDLIPKSAGSEIFESMRDEELMNQAALSGGTGLADIMYRQLTNSLQSTF
jgi:peptidoglycan hydrolase FlgJ